MNGAVNLGPKFGSASSVAVLGLTPEEAATAIERHVREVLKRPLVRLTVRKNPYRDQGNRLQFGDELDGHEVGPLLYGCGGGRIEDGVIRLGPNDGINYGEVRVEGLTLEEANAAVNAHLQRILTQQKVSVRWLAHGGTVSSPPYLPLQPHRLKIGDILYIGARNTIIDEPIDGYFAVSPDGAIDLGAYGTCSVAGMTVAETTAVIQQQLREVLAGPETCVELVKTADEPGWYLPLAPYRVKATDSLNIRASNTSVDFPIDDIYFCSSDGTVDLGPPYGSVAVAGMTLDEVRDAIECQLRHVLRYPEVSVSLGAEEGIGMLLQLAKPAWRLPLYDLDFASSRGKGSRFSADRPMDCFTRASNRRTGRRIKELREAIENGQIEPETLLPSPWCFPLAAYRIKPTDKLRIDVANTFLDQPIQDDFSVGADGQVTLGSAYGSVSVAGMGIEEATVAIEIHLREVLNYPEVCVSLIEPSGAAGWYMPLNQYRLKPYDTVRIDVSGALAGQPIDDIFWLGPDASVNLGLAYGWIQLGGMSLDDATAAVTTHLREILRNPKVSIELLKASDLSEECLPLAPYRIKADDYLKIGQAETLSNASRLDGIYHVDANGMLMLGESYGSLQVVDKTFDEAAVAIAAIAEKGQKNVAVSVELAAPWILPAHAGRSLHNIQESPEARFATAGTRVQGELTIPPLADIERRGQPRASRDIGGGIEATVIAFRTWTPPGPKWTTVEKLPYRDHACWKLDGSRLIVFSDHLPSEAGQCSTVESFLSGSMCTRKATQLNSTKRLFLETAVAFRNSTNRPSSCTFSSGTPPRLAASVLLPNGSKVFPCDFLLPGIMGSRMKPVRDLETQGRTCVTELALTKNGSIGFELAPLAETCTLLLFDIPTDTRLIRLQLREAESIEIPLQP
jgi:protein involved in polysaccharide export with SLBB domain